MKKALNDVHKAVLNLEDETGRKRSDLFRELPDRRVRDLAELTTCTSC